MKENKKLLGLAIMASLLFAAGIFQAQSISGASDATSALSLMNLKVSPAPGVAGDNITVSFQLFNSYSQSLSQVNLQLQAENPIINISPSYSYLINNIGTGEYGGLSYDYFTYKLKVPSTLQSGEYTLDVVAQYQTSDGTGSGTEIAAQSVIPINIYVYGKPQISLNILPSSQIIPGKDFTAELTAVNSGTGTARNLTIQILNGTSFAPDGPSEFSMGILAPGASASSTASIFTYRNISAGENFLNAKVTYLTGTGNTVITSANVPINILVNAPQIVASVAGANPPQLLPGGNQTVSVLIQNIGTGLAENLSINFINGNYVSASGAASYFFIGTLPAGGEATEEVFISANRSANQSTYSLPAIASYQYENYNGTITKKIYVPIKVQNSAVFNVTSVSSPVQLGVNYKPVTFNVKNIGNEEATSVTFSLQTVYPITPTTPDAYVQSLAPGQSANVTFYVNVDSSGSGGEYPVTLYEQWRQPDGATNQQYYGSNNYFISVSGGGGGGIYEIIAAAVVIIVAGAFVYKKRIKPRMEGKKARKA